MEQTIVHYHAVADGYIEVVNNICDIHHYYSSGIIVASSKWYEGLSEEDQKLVKESAVKAGEEQRAWFLENDEAKIAEYEEKGYTVTRPTDIDAWKEKRLLRYMIKCTRNIRPGKVRLRWFAQRNKVQ